MRSWYGSVDPRSVRSTTPRLTATSFALLGAVAQTGPCSPYDLKRVLARSIGPLWEVPHSQLYDEAARLARAGLLTETQEGKGRRRLSYEITEDGRRALLRWLRVPGRDRIEIRDVGLLKLGFADLLDPAEVRHLAQDHLDAWREVRDDLAAEVDGSAGRYTRALAGAAMAFWEHLERSVSEPGTPPTPDVPGPALVPVGAD
jgi:PadR family transcriptional regulator, regulatory protein AphA